MEYAQGGKVDVGVFFFRKSATVKTNVSPKFWKQRGEDKKKKKESFFRVKNDSGSPFLIT